MIIDMDNTIALCLEEYRKYIKRLVSREEKRVQTTKFKNTIDRELAMQDLLNIKRSYNFLTDVATYPRKYLYSQANIKYNIVTLGDQVGSIRQVGHLPCAQSISDKLAPLYNLVNQYNGFHVVHELSCAISGYMCCNNIKNLQKWTYREREPYDWAAECILDLNKQAKLANMNDFQRMFKDVMPASWFAIKIQKGK